MNSLIFEALKRTLKAKGVTYRELAERMGVSEPTVKRIFHERNCKLDRLRKSALPPASSWKTCSAR
jgi:transcriptional regulator with XRE-family HTH domain